MESFLEHDGKEAMGMSRELPEVLVSLKEAGDLRAYLRGIITSTTRKKASTRTFHVLVNESASLKLLKGTKDLFPYSYASHTKWVDNW